MLSVGGQKQIRMRAKRAQRDMFGKKKGSKSQWDEVQSVAMMAGGQMGVMSPPGFRKQPLWAGWKAVNCTSIFFLFSFLEGLEQH